MPDYPTPIFVPVTLVSRLERENETLRAEVERLREVRALQDWEREHYAILRSEVRALNKALAHERSEGTAQRLRQEIRKYQRTIEQGIDPNYVPPWKKVQAEFDAKRAAAKRAEVLRVDLPPGCGWTHCY